MKTYLIVMLCLWMLSAILNMSKLINENDKKERKIRLLVLIIQIIILFWTSTLTKQLFVL